MRNREEIEVDFCKPCNSGGKFLVSFGDKKNQMTIEIEVLRLLMDKFSFIMRVLIQIYP